MSGIRRLRHWLAEFGFGHVEPASMFGGVVPFEPLGETTRFGGGEGRVERGRRMRAEIVLDQPDLFGVGKMHVGQFRASVRNRRRRGDR